MAKKNANGTSEARRNMYAELRTKLDEIAAAEEGVRQLAAERAEIVTRLVADGAKGPYKMGDKLLKVRQLRGTDPAIFDVSESDLSGVEEIG